MIPIRQRLTRNDDSREAVAAVTHEDAYNSNNEGIEPSTPISRDSSGLFRDHLIDAAKERADWKTGIEIELFGFRKNTHSRLTPADVESLLMAFARETGVTLFEHSLPIETTIDDGGRITIEPGGQIEFSSLPRLDFAEIASDVEGFRSSLRQFAAEQGVIFVALGFDPINPISRQHWYPKQRYSVMRPYLASRGVRAWDMMTRTCAVQVNLDYDSEADLAAKFVVGNRLAPIVTAMFANSPFEDGGTSGYKSTRAAAWLDTDSDRAGISPAASFDFSIDRFVDYALATPMIFVRREGEYDGTVAGLKFSDFLSSRERSFAPVFQDWTDHLSTIFTEARLKQYIELRSVDGNHAELALAAAALWKGIMYDEGALDNALRLIPKLSHNEWIELQRSVAVGALDAKACGINVGRTAIELVEISVNGLQNIAPDEVRFLDPLRQLVCDDHICPADILLKNWYGGWNRSIAQVMDYARVA